MRDWRTWLLLLSFAIAAGAQDQGGGEEEEDDDTEIEIGGVGADVSTPIEIKVDPFEDTLEPVEEPNRPTPIKVGQWTPPSLGDVARRELEGILAERGASAEDAGVRYRLAGFYLRHGWFPQAESEYLSCAQLDQRSIRPWEGLLRVYRGDAERARASEEEELNRLLPPGVPAALRNQLRRDLLRDLRRGESDWLASPRERNQRITRAYEEILRRRPDDIARRHELIAHLEGMRDYARLVVHARAVLALLPGDAKTRYLLAEALRREAYLLDIAEPGKGDGRREESMRLLERNVKEAPEHAPSALRLARMIAVHEGYKAKDRFLELERRGFFHLFVVEDLAPVPYREDTFRMARQLAGPRIANRLWDRAMVPEKEREARRWPGESRYYQRWIELHFPHSMPRERERTIATLARRGDQAAVGTLVSYLWHAAEPGEIFTDNEVEQRTMHARLIDQAIDASARFRGICYPVAERFLKLADTPTRRRRAVRLLRALRDPRGVEPLLDALAWDVAGEEASYGVAAALEDLRDPRAIDALVEAALDVRRLLPRRLEAAEALASFPDPRAIEALNQLAREESFRLVTAYGLFRLNGDEDSLGTMRTALTAGGDPAREVLRLLRKWEDPRFVGLLLHGLAEASRELRPELMAMLKERYWKIAAGRVREILMAEVSRPDCSHFAIRELGSMGGEEAAGVLWKRLQDAKGEEWEVVANAFARTGDDRAVRYFNRMRILEKVEDRRRLARTLHNLAQASKASRDRAEAE